MRAFDPVISVSREPVEFQFRSAERVKGTGIIASVQALNGTVLAAARVKLEEPADRMHFAAVVSAKSALSIADGEGALVEALRRIELALRPQRRRPATDQLHQTDLGN